MTNPLERQTPLAPEGNSAEYVYARQINSLQCLEWEKMAYARLSRALEKHPFQTPFMAEGRRIYNTVDEASAPKQQRAGEILTPLSNHRWIIQRSILGALP